jgi:aminoglycoside 2''-phosphotransferase
MSGTIRQGEVDLEDLVARIRCEFPDLALAEARLVDEGEDNAVIILGDRWVFRFPRTPEEAARAPVERRLLAALGATTSIAIPRYDHVARAGDFGGYRMIEGESLTTAAFAGLSRAAREGVLAEIGEFLRMLHALPAAVVARPPGEERPWRAIEFIERYAERREALAKALGASLVLAADRFYEALPNAVATDRVVVVHLDLSEDHILVDPAAGRLAGVIDFSDAGLGDPACDFTCLWAYGPQAPERVLEAYGTGGEAAGILSRSLWWFTRYRIDQVWWSISGARAYDVAEIKRDLAGLFEALGV